MILRISRKFSIFFMTVIFKRIWLLALQFVQHITDGKVQIYAELSRYIFLYYLCMNIFINKHIIRKTIPRRPMIKLGLWLDAMNNIRKYEAYVIRWGLPLSFSKMKKECQIKLMKIWFERKLWIFFVHNKYIK